MISKLVASARAKGRRRLQRSRCRPRAQADHCPTTTLAHAKNRRLADRPASYLELLGVVLVGFLAADERFIDFDDAAELLEIGSTARLAQPVQDEPSRLLRDPFPWRAASTYPYAPSQADTSRKSTYAAERASARKSCPCEP
jgi:hypothetical protein